MTPRTPSVSASSHTTPRASREKLRDEESEIESTGPGRPSQDTVAPVILHQCPNHVWYTEELPTPDPEERIKITVGTAPNSKTFLIHRSLICQHSAYFAAALKEGNEKLFIEAESGEFHWPDDDPSEFHRWVRWLYSCKHCRLWEVYDARHVCKEGDELEKDPHTWCAPDVEAEQAFMFGDRVVSPEYCLFALASFIQHVHLADPERIVWAYENAPERSGLRRFAFAWLGWMKFRLDKKTEIGPDEEAAVAAYSGAFATFEGWTSLDPRRYFMEHWKESCSLEINNACKHKRLAKRGGRHEVYPESRRAKLARYRREMAWNGTVSIWYGCCIAMLVLSAYIYARDREGLIVYSAKMLSIVTACFAVVGMCLCGDIVPVVTTPIVAMTFAAAIFSSHQAAKCFQLAMTPNTSLCKIQTGLASVEMLYVLWLTGMLCTCRRKIQG